METHNITSAQDISVQLPDLESERKRILIKIKSEPVDPEEMTDTPDKNGLQSTTSKTQEDEEEQEQPSVDSKEDAEQEGKVPPLRIKLPHVVSPTLMSNPSSKASAEASNLPHEEQGSHPTGFKAGKDLYSCLNCKFKSNNSYIFGRHRKSCNKKRKLLEKEHGNLESNDYDPSTTNESSLYDGEDGEEEYTDTNTGALVHEPEDSIEVPVEFDGDNEEVNNLSDGSNEKILDVHMDVVAPNLNEDCEDVETETMVNRGSIEEDEFEDSHGSDEGEEIQMGPDDEIEEGIEPSEECDTADYGIVSVEDRKECASDSDHDDVDMDETEEVMSESEKLPHDNEISDSAIEESDITTNVETNGNENDSEDEETSLGET